MPDWRAASDQLGDTFLRLNLLSVDGEGYEFRVHCNFCRGDLDRHRLRL